jgi:hypothetical protein
MARRQSYRTRQADPEEPRYSPSSSGAPSSMVAAFAIVVVVVVLAGAALFFSQHVKNEEKAEAAAAEKAAAANAGPKPFADLPEPSDEPFRKTWSNATAREGGPAAPVPESLRGHTDWEEATRLEAEAHDFLRSAEVLREEGDLGWRESAKEALTRFDAMLETTEPWVSVLQNQVGTSDPGYRAFMKRRDGWLEKRAALQRLL